MTFEITSSADIAQYVEAQLEGGFSVDSDARTALRLVGALAKRVAYLEAQPERDDDAYWKTICKNIQRACDYASCVTLLNHEAAYLMRLAKIAREQGLHEINPAPVAEMEKPTPFVYNHNDEHDPQNGAG
jgi:hypothetical protein